MALSRQIRRSAVGSAACRTGYNYRLGWLVLGVEGESTWSRARGVFPCFSLGDQACSADPEWTGSLAGRIGAALGPALFYLKGGAAWVHNSYSNMATCSGIQPPGDARCGDLFTASGTRSGWLVGVGGEYRFLPNWSVKVEYDYLRFGERSVAFNDGQGNFFTELIRQDMHLIKVGANYHFGTWDPAPLSTYAYKAPRASPRSGSSVEKVPGRLLMRNPQTRSLPSVGSTSANTACTDGLAY